MSLQIPIQKDIGEYEEKIIGKLSFRTLLCLAGGFVSAIATAAICQFLLGVEVADAASPVICASIPFWLAGFWRPYGMRAEKFAPLLFDHAFHCQKLLYESPGEQSTKVEKGKTTIRTRRACKRKGAELNEPTVQESKKPKRGFAWRANPKKADASQMEAA